jgi:hypothetical protein
MLHYAFGDLSSVRSVLQLPVVIGMTLSAVMALVTPANAAPIVTIQSATPSVTLGTPVTVDVQVGAQAGAADDVVDLYAYQFSISFDPLLLSAQSIFEGSFLSSAGSTIFVPGLIDNSVGIITFNAKVLSGPVSGASGDGTLLSVLFATLAVGTSSLNVIVDPLNGDGFFDSSLVEITPITLTPGSQQIITTAVPEPTTLLLLGPAVVALHLRRHKSRRRAVRTTPSH